MSLSLVVGVRRASSTAIAVLGAPTVADTLGRMQPAAMSGATQASLKTRKGLLDELRLEIEALSDTEPPTLEPVTRVTPLAVGALVAMVILVYILAPVLADLPGLFGELSGVDPWWSIPAIAATAAAFVAGAVQILGSVASRLPVGPTLAAQVATAFAGKFKPAGVGAASVERRYLQREGIDARSATRAVGLRQFTTVVSYVVLIAVFVLWWVRSDNQDRLVSPSALLIGLALAVGLGALAMVVPATRRTVIGTSLPLARNAMPSVRAALNNPGRLSWVFLGAAARLLFGALAFFYTAHAFGIRDEVVAIMTIYLISSAIASLAPTPGGLGAVEVALIGGLMALGVTGAIAVPSVFLYRLITFWLPTLPGWISFRWLRRSERL